MPFFETTVPGPEWPDGDAPVFDALVEPNDSLGDDGFLLFVIAVLGILGVVEIAILASGCWVVGLFLAGDAAFLLFAMMLFRNRRDMFERITIAGGAIRIANRIGRKETTRRLAIFGLSLERDDDPDYGCLGLWLRLRDQRIEIGKSLSHHERTCLGDRLEAAIRAAGGKPRAERRLRAPLLSLAANEA